MIKTARIEQIIESVDTDSLDRDLEILKSATLPEEIELAKNKLKSTLILRREQIKNPNFQIHENCQYFFVCPELVSIYKLI